MKDTSHKILNRMIDLKYDFHKDGAAETEYQELQKFTGNLPVMTTVDIDTNSLNEKRFIEMGFGPINF